MKLRKSSILTAVAYIMIGGMFAYAAPRCRELCAPLIDRDVVLPLLTRIVLGLGATGWFLLGAGMAAVVIGKDLLPGGSKISDSIFRVIVLLILGAALVGLLRLVLIAMEGL